MIYHTPQISISQLTHAHLSRIIVETLVINSLPKHLILPLAIACHYHDHGWKDWEENPSINPTTKVPYDFQEINTNTHIKIWKDSRKTAATQHPLAGYLVSKHNTYLSDITMKHTPIKKNHKILITFKQQETIHQIQLLEDIETPPSPSELTILQHYLTIADYISLMVCLNKTNHTKIINTLPISIQKKQKTIAISVPLSRNINYILRGKNQKTKRRWEKKIQIISDLIE